MSAVIHLWALFGGLIIVGLALITAASATGKLLLGAPFPADHELVKHFVAIAVFMFLPYCQLTHANVTVDVFTEGMSETKKALMELVASLVALGFSLLLFRQMYLGMGGYLLFPEVTPVLGLPLWTAFPAMLASLLLLMVASILTTLEALRAYKAASAASAPSSKPARD
ncbi:TRAP transporter small permease [Rhizobium sp. TRM95111]|uniref:TRAP transporter small permease n=1 Tax=Rhizobium alarense TaxID=2846851 RepID=UPI001F23F0D6|nr:TRAP transporter small permease [Rhizobium alarense]MCF3639829.1 TRAP transporter small permease [Rhizobium alarense]